MTEYEKQQALEYCRKGYTVSEILMILPIEPKELRELVQAENIQGAECVDFREIIRSKDRIKKIRSFSF